MADKKINILVSANTTGVSKGFNEAAAAIAKGGSEIVQGSAKISEAVVGTQKSLQQEYRATYKAAQILAEQQGTNSAAFREAATAAAQYKDRLEDVQDAIKAASPEQRWKLVGSAISGATDVAQGLVGAMSLVGIESNNAAKFIQAMMSIAAVGQIVPGIIALGEAYAALSIVLTSTVLPALAAVTVEMALATAGISLIVAGIAYLAYKGIQHYNDLGTAAKQAGQEMTAQNEIYRKAFAGEKGAMKPFSMKQNEFNEGIKPDAAPTKRYKAQYNELKTHTIAMKDLLVMASDAQQNVVDKILDKGWAKINSTNLKGMGQFKADFKGLLTFTREVSIEMEGMITNVLVSSFTLLGDTIADIFNGEIDGEGMLKSLGQILSSFMMALGTALVTAGIAALTFQKLLMNPYAAIVAGGALIVAASVVSGLLKSGPSGSKSGSGGSGGGGDGGGYAPRNSAITYAPDGGMISLGGLVRGNDIIIASHNTERSNNRIR